jgi:sugar lactone lactonase YvrE
VADGQNSRLLRFGPDGAFRSAIALERGTGARKTASLEAVDVGEDGMLYVTDGVRNVAQKFTPEGRLLGEWPVPFPGDVSVNAERVVITGPNGVAVFDTNGKQLALLGAERGTGDEQFDVPRGVVVDDDGTMFVSDTQNKRVKAYDRTGKLLWISEALHKDVLDQRTGEVARIVEESSETSGLAHQFQIPVGLTLDASHRLVVLDPFEFGLWVLDPDEKGKIVGHYGTFGPEDGKFIYPTRLDYDPARDWFAVADTTNDRVQIVEIPGSGGDARTRARRLLDLPWWLCCLPLFALLLAAFLLYRAKRQRDAKRGAEDAAPVDSREPEGEG